MNRRHLLAWPAACGLGSGLLAQPAPAAAAPLLPAAWRQRCAALERQCGGRLGVAVRDGRQGHADAGPRNAPVLGWRLHERFPLCSTFKWLAAAAVLRRVDAGELQLAQRLRYASSDVVSYSPVTGAHADGPGLSLAALCDAAITLSDNTAGNLLLQAIGGPPGLTAFVRSLGDGVTRLDRIEPELNTCWPGDPRDTTTPAAMLGLLRRLLLGTALSAGSRQQLVDWMRASRTSGQRLRAPLTPGWVLADKTGSGERGTASDVGVLWTPAGTPVVVAVYLSGAGGPSEADAAARSAVIAQVARWIVQGA